MKRSSRWSPKAEVPHWDMCPGPTELLFTGYSTELIQIPRFRSGKSSPGRWNRLFSLSAFSALKIAPKPCRRDRRKVTMRKESSPNRNQQEMWAGRLTAPSLTASSSSVNFVPKDHDVRFEVNTERLVEQSKQNNLAKSDAVEDSHVSSLEANSMVSTGALVGRSLDQTVKSQVSTGRIVTKNSATEIDEEATEECNILSAASISFRDKGEWESASDIESPSRKRDGLIHDFFNACSYLSWKRLHRECALRQKYRSKINRTEILRWDSKVDSRTKVGDIGSVRIALVEFYMG